MSSDRKHFLQSWLNHKIVELEHSGEKEGRDQRAK